MVAGQGRQLVRGEEDQGPARSCRTTAAGGLGHGSRGSVLATPLGAVHPLSAAGAGAHPPDVPSNPTQPNPKWASKAMHSTGPVVLHSPGVSPRPSSS